MKNLTDKEILELIKKIGFSDKAAKLYLASLELGEATVQDLARQAKIERTTAYYTLKELKESGAVFETKRNKKVFFLPEMPRNLLRSTRERLSDFEDGLEAIESRKHAIYRRPRLYFLYGPSGFKHIWDMIFKSEDKEFRIITEGYSFLDFVKERYILEDIIKMKKQLNIKSRQIITDSPYGRDIVAKDRQENRESRILPKRVKIPFTEVIASDFVAFISPRWDNTLFVIENEHFAETRRNLFEAMWQTLPDPSKN